MVTDSLSPSDWLTLLFAAALSVGVAIKVWLASRQTRHVSANRNSVPQAFAKQISLAAHQKAADYTIAKTRFGLLELALGTVVLLGWTLLGGMDLLNTWILTWLGIQTSPILQQLALVAAFVFVGAVVDVPTTLYQTFVLEERFGFNKTSLRLWLSDLLKSTLIGAGIGLPVAAVILWVMGTLGNLWWLWAWGFWMSFNLLLMLVYPSFIAPLFNKFNPLKDEVLAARVTALMQRCGFTSNGLFVMDGSTRSAHANAYFTGFGASKRVVFYDTLLAKLSAGEVDAVLAHELGHFKHKHIVKRVVSMFALSLVGFALLGWLATQTWFYTGLGVNPNLASPNDALVLLLFLLAVPVFGFFVSPVLAHMSRGHEFEADAYAVEQTNSVDLATALLKLYEDNAATLTPDPLFVKFYYSHPPASERLSRIAA